jgi:hypothetical protein
MEGNLSALEGFTSGICRVCKKNISPFTGVYTDYVIHRFQR